MKTPLIFCILSALLGLGVCLQCEVCANLDRNCVGRMETCHSGEDSCGITVFKTVIMGIDMQGVTKSCVPASECRASPAVMRFKNGITLSSSTTCCVGDACSTASVTMPPENRTQNGRRCPACYSVFNAPCGEETLDCTGAETQCITVAGHLILNVLSLQATLKGCATESACTNVKVDSDIFGGTNVQITTVTCRPAPGSCEPDCSTAVQIKEPAPSASGTAKGQAPNAVSPTRGSASHAADVTPGPSRLLLTGLLLMKWLFYSLHYVPATLH